MMRGQVLDKLLSTLPVLLLLVFLVGGFIGFAFLARTSASGERVAVASAASTALPVHLVRSEGKDLPLVYALQGMIEERVSKSTFLEVLQGLPGPDECVYVSWGITPDYNGLLRPFAQGGAPWGALLVRNSSRLEIIDSTRLGSEFAVSYVSVAFVLPVRVSLGARGEYDVPFLFYQGACR